MVRRLRPKSCSISSFAVCCVAAVEVAGEELRGEFEQPFGFPLRIFLGIVAPPLKQRKGEHPVADNGAAQGVGHHAVAPHRIQIPVVGDLVIVPHHVGRDIGHGAADLMLVFQRLNAIVPALVCRCLVPPSQIVFELLNETLETCPARPR